MNRLCRSAALLIALLLALPAAALADTPASNLGQSLGLSTENRFLPADEAFHLSARVVGADTIAAHWKIADGYYMYRHRFHFRVLQGTGVRIGKVELPRGKMKDDGTFGRVEVFYHEVTARLPIVRTGAAASAPEKVTLQFVYQGCAEQGICYPPITRERTFVLPVAAAASGASPTASPTATPGATPGTAGATPAGTAAPTPAAAPAPAAPVSEQDRLAHLLITGHLWVTLPTFFGLGLLLAFTPCVFPMIPILSGILVGQGKELRAGRGFSLSLVYVLAMAATYTAAGVIAALFGQNLQATLQNPWVLWAFALVFVFLALCMFGCYDLQVPSFLQSRITAVSNRQKGGTFAGVAVMGVLSALIVGPCVAAPLAGALIVIGQTGDPVLGGLALFSLSLGMGAPLLLVGASAGKLLPKAGPWMDVIKGVFGVMLLAVAIYILERILPAPVILALWAVLLITSAIYMGALDSLSPGVSGWRRLWKGLGLVMLLYGGLMMVGAATGGGDPLRPLQAFSVTAGGHGGGAEAARMQFRRVSGVDGLDRALAAARAQGRPVMLDFYADWCISCKELEKYTFSDPKVQQALAGVELLQADVTPWNAQDQALAHKFDLLGPPAILFFTPDGRELRNYRVIGFMDPQKFRAHVEEALRAAS